MSNSKVEYSPEVRDEIYAQFEDSGVGSAHYFKTIVKEHPEYFLVRKLGHGIIGVARTQEQADKMIAECEDE